MSDENNLSMSDEEMDYEDAQQAAKRDWTYREFGDGDDHGWTQSEIDQYEDWLMSNDPGIQPDGSYCD
ncbi:hypothetical protein LMB33_05580 [Limosilactobacillus reuteri]|uniref:hypothetical protein n=1 Tax=Limosilactobacillus reuteri TaxID=1598 RepID=UPI001E4A2868|nr:hypothetical protein [Limosilactobacillus reuteri]MCC4326093.1 hypothetical protein [Limosilactobacillus reuteri]MCC4329843.1 hypothetical protein [Limosilactobacillus reuteri]